MLNFAEEDIEPGFRRRTFVRGAAWTVPVVALAAAAPVFASSPVPPGGLNGWVELQKSCDSNRSGPTKLVIDGKGSYDSRGLWVFVDPQGPTPSGANIVFYFKKPNLTFTNGSEAGWSNLVRAAGLDSAGPAAGYFAYQTVYTGSWTYKPQGQKRWEAVSDPYFSTTYETGDCVSISAYARRTVTTALGTVSFTRGPVTV